ncbi:uncharacterized protein LOC113227819 isoform X2 [Hyposmocoma kahamanoa]|uniref:uncharacterized protein LOC113227819 isoform X2 n=1 Tax=Hyposmocoma kahamanoa TaxID=1477025 RepID=UPI000E6D7820|nr:uncharacterized protein LOC113227819 isoform X2 [Hyposmocoma kahamanoa]
MDYLRMSYFEESAPHSLLDPTPCTYSSSTIRRAFIVWLHCGQSNEFRDVCKYYHYLEAMENQLASDVCSSSRSHEEELFRHTPPTSQYLKENFPRLYSQNSTDYSYLKTWETLKNETLANFDVTKIITNNGTSKPYQYVQKMQNMKTSSSFLDAQYIDNIFIDNHENVKTGRVKIVEVTEIENKTPNKDKTIKEVKIQPGFLNEISGTTKHDIVEVSQMIRNHCKNHLIPLNKFLNEFKEYGERSELKNTVHNVSFYIKRKMIHAEMKMIADQKNNLKTFEDEFDLISFEDIPAKQQEVKANVDDFNENKNINDCIENKVVDNSTKAIKDNVNEKNDVKTVAPLRAIVKTGAVKDDFATGDTGSVAILSRDDGNTKNGSGFSNSFVTLETMKGRKI